VLVETDHPPDARDYVVRELEDNRFENIGVRVSNVVERKDRHMTESEFYNLRRGDIVRNLRDGSSYVIVCQGERGPIATRTVEITNHPEWFLFSKSEEIIRDDSE